MKGKLKSLFLLMICVLFITSTCSAATLWYYWPNTPRTVTFNCSFSTNEREAVRSAMQQWNGVTDSSGRSIISMYLSNYVTSDNIVNYSLYINAVATTQPYVIGGEVQSVNIILNSNYQWSVGASAGKYDIQTVVLHELGHALGVGHCHEIGYSCGSICSSNVMNPIIGTGTVRTTFQYYDTSTYRSIYD